MLTRFLNIGYLDRHNAPDYTTLISREFTTFQSIALQKLEFYFMDRISVRIFGLSPNETEVSAFREYAHAYPKGRLGLLIQNWAVEEITLTSLDEHEIPSFLRDRRRLQVQLVVSADHSRFFAEHLQDSDTACQKGLYHHADRHDE